MSRIGEIQVDQDTDLLCDKFTLNESDLIDFIAQKSDFIITQGYGTDTITVLEGSPDDWQIAITPQDLKIAVIGRDYLKLAIDTYYRNTFFFNAPTSAPKDQFGDFIPYSIGSHTALDIAQSACNLAGLSLSWECPNYPVVNEVVDTQGFSGTVAEVISRLIAPLQHTKMFKIDVYALGRTVHVKQRQWPYVPDYEMTLTQARILGGLSIKRVDYKGVPIRWIICSQKVAGNSIIINRNNSGDSGVDVVSAEQFDSQGQLIAQDITTTTRSNGNVTTQEKRTFRCLPGANTMSLVETAVTSFDYIVIQNYSKIVGKSTSGEIYSQSTPNSDNTYLSQVANTKTSFVYDSLDQLLQEIQAKTSTYYDKKGNVKKDSQGNDMVTTEVDSTTHTPLDSFNISTLKTKTINGIMVAKDESTSTGQLPGPRKVGQIRGRSGGGNNTTPWVRKVVVGSVGRDVVLESDVLTQGQLINIASQIKTEQAHTEYELTMPLLPMPWIRKGMKIRFTGSISDGLGNSFDVGQLVFLITNIESRLSDKSLTGMMKGIAWL